MSVRRRAAPAACVSSAHAGSRREQGRTIRARPRPTTRRPGQAGGARDRRPGRRQWQRQADQLDAQRRGDDLAAARRAQARPRSAATLRRLARCRRRSRPPARSQTTPVKSRRSRGRSGRRPPPGRHWTPRRRRPALDDDEVVEPPVGDRRQPDAPEFGRLDREGPGAQAAVARRPGDGAGGDAVAAGAEPGAASAICRVRPWELRIIAEEGMGRIDRAELEAERDAPAPRRPAPDGPRVGRPRMTVGWSMGGSSEQAPTSGRAASRRREPIDSSPGRRDRRAAPEARRKAFCRARATATGRRIVAATPSGGATRWAAEGAGTAGFRLPRRRRRRADRRRRARSTSRRPTRRLLSCSGAPGRRPAPGGRRGPWPSGPGRPHRRRRGPRRRPGRAPTRRTPGRPGRCLSRSSQRRPAPGVTAGGGGAPLARSPRRRRIAAGRRSWISRVSILVLDSI